METEKCRYNMGDYCEFFSDGEIKQPCPEGPCPAFERIPTNADRIRGMSDLELAELLEGICSARDQIVKDRLRGTKFEGAVILIETPIESRMAHLGWLQQPAQEEGEQNV